MNSYVFVEVEFGDSYCFFIIGIDSVGNWEFLKLVGELDCMSIEIVEISFIIVGQNNGVVVINVIGNNGDLSYQWLYDFLFNEVEVSGFVVGIYEVYVIDVVGCEVVVMIIIDVVNSIFVFLEEVFIFQLYFVFVQDYLEVIYFILEFFCYVQVFVLDGSIFYQEFIWLQGNMWE